MIYFTHASSPTSKTDFEPEIYTAIKNSNYVSKNKLHFYLCNKIFFVAFNPRKLRFL